MKNRFVFSVVLLLCIRILPVHAWSQNLTQIADTLFNADGTKASGRIVISWEPFTASSGETIDGGTKTYTVPSSGLSAGEIDLSLVPNIGATPSGTSYQARYFLANGASYSETWVVPATGPVTIADIRASSTPMPNLLMNFSRVVGGTPGRCARFNASGVLSAHTDDCGSGGGGGEGNHNLLSSTHSDTTSASVVLGDLLHGSATPAWARLAGNSTTTKKFLTQTGTGSASAVPSWGAIQSGDLPSHNAATATALAANGTNCSTGNYPLGVDSAGNAESCTGAGTGTVTSVGTSFTGGLISVAGSPITSTGTIALTVAGTSGGIPYFSGSATWASSGALTANLPMIGGGAGAAPTVGTRSGNTTAFVTTTGSQTSGDCVKIDANGNHVANGSACGGGGGGTVTERCVIDLDTQSEIPLTDSQVTGRCDVPASATLTEVAVYSSSGTPSIILERWRPNGGSAADLLSGALATGASGAYACARSGTSATCTSGITSSGSITTSNTSLSAGDVIRVKTPSAGGTATWFHIVAIYTLP